MSRAKKRPEFWNCENFKFIKKGLYKTHFACTLCTTSVNGGGWKDCKVATGKAMKCAHFENKEIKNDKK